ncbi:hypothetical protein [Acetobacter senegalensis]|uniref:hypothetical protein n=1 Tax=Acetobacter senegalensis TaxID=446692 RepID=UPI001EDA9B85|nr:hypothetical protein [Acetobacter senegalensis]MCG4258165.1 hypothetical protein [Acetobacter senegalensis]MCG4268092.1 hypothetical protein [Acetobacter senegalensis]
MTGEPTGVFVRLPLSEEQVKTLEYRLEGYNSALLAIGTPVADGGLYPIGYINEDAIGGLATGVYQSASIFRDEDVEHHDTVALTRLSEALAKLAEKDAEIERKDATISALIKEQIEMNDKVLEKIQEIMKTMKVPEA